MPIKLKKFIDIHSLYKGLSLGDRQWLFNRTKNPLQKNVCAAHTITWQFLLSFIASVAKLVFLTALVPNAAPTKGAQ